MSQPQPTLAFFLERHNVEPALASILLDVAKACIEIGALCNRGALAAVKADTTTNVQGEDQKPLDVISNDLFLQHSLSNPALAGAASEEMEDCVPGTLGGRYLLVFDPLDGSSNIDVNVSIGSIFSVLPHTGSSRPTAADFYQPGSRQVAAGYALYGPATVLVISTGHGTHAFTLDRERREFVLSHASMRVPEDSSEYAINGSNERFWEAPVLRYINECRAGSQGPREHDFNTRWVASMVADIHRILTRGGIYLYPRDNRQPLRLGRLRLLYEGAPMALLIEQAGGRGSTGRQGLLDVVPTELHQRVPIIIGSRNEVERVERYHAAHDNGEDQPFESPLFKERSLFMPEN